MKNEEDYDDGKKQGMRAEPVQNGENYLSYVTYEMEKPYVRGEPAAKEEEGRGGLTQKMIAGLHSRC